MSRFMKSVVVMAAAFAASAHDVQAKLRASQDTDWVKKKLDGMEKMKGVFKTPLKWMANSDDPSSLDWVDNYYTAGMGTVGQQCSLGGIAGYLSGLATGKIAKWGACGAGAAILCMGWLQNKGKYLTLDLSEVKERATGVTAVIKEVDGKRKCVVDEVAPGCNMKKDAVILAFGTTRGEMQPIKVAETVSSTSDDDTEIVAAVNAKDIVFWKIEGKINRDAFATLDANGDGKISAADAFFVLRGIAASVSGVDKADEHAAAKSKSRADGFMVAFMFGFKHGASMSAM